MRTVYVPYCVFVEACWCTVYLFLGLACSLCSHRRPFFLCIMHTITCDPRSAEYYWINFSKWNIYIYNIQICLSCACVCIICFCMYTHVCVCLYIYVCNDACLCVCASGVGWGIWKQEMKNSSQFNSILKKLQCLLQQLLQERRVWPKQIISVCL